MAAIRYTTLHSQLVKFSRGCVFLLFTLLLKRRRVNFSAKTVLFRKNRFHHVAFEFPGNANRVATPLFLPPLRAPGALETEHCIMTV